MLNKLVMHICLTWKPHWTPQRTPFIPSYLRPSGRTHLQQVAACLLGRDFWHYWLARYPQTWLWLWSGIAWSILISRMLAQYRMPDICTSTPQLFSRQFISMSIDWCLMIIAMMLPLLKEQTQHVASRMPSTMRSTAIQWFLLAYVLQWLLTGLLIYVLAYSSFNSLPDLTGQINMPSAWRTALPVFGFALAACWVCSPMRRNAQLACSRTIPMRIHGWGARTDSLHYGILSGNFCLRTCWAPMLALMLAQHGLFLMLLVASLLVYERYFLSFKSRALAYAWAGIALAFLLQILFTSQGQSI